MGIVMGAGGGGGGHSTPSYACLCVQDGASVREERRSRCEAQ